jgi:hypothetical protein
MTGIPEKTQQNDKKIPVKKTDRELLSLSKRTTFQANESNIKTYNRPDSIVPRSDPQYSSITAVPVSFDSGFKGEVLPNDLIALNQTPAVSVFDDGRSKFSRFIAKTFREKILREKTGKDSPLKGYEIAEAGVSGLNKLLGWEMALDEKKDENGELRSVYFSSRILKFNAPVKKSEPLQ